MDLSSDEKLALAILLFLVFLGSILIIWRNAWWLRAPDAGYLVASGNEATSTVDPPISRDGSGEAALTTEDRSSGGETSVGVASGAGRPSDTGDGPVEMDGHAGSARDRASPVALVVHVAGAVKEPGVYSLAEGARIKDAVDAAGGPLPEAAVHFLNLAERLIDGQKIYVPTEKEVKEALAGEGQIKSGGAYTRGAPGAAYSSVPADEPQGKPPKVNINTATAAELDALPGIGPVLAERIVRSRSEEGPFNSVDDLKRVRGIGDSLLKELKNLVTVK